MKLLTLIVSQANKLLIATTPCSACNRVIFLLPLTLKGILWKCNTIDSWYAWLLQLGFQFYEAIFGDGKMPSNFNFKVVNGSRKFITKTPYRKWTRYWALPIWFPGLQSSHFFFAFCVFVIMVSITSSGNEVEAGSIAWRAAAIKIWWRSTICGMLGFHQTPVPVAISRQTGTAKKGQEEQQTVESIPLVVNQRERPNQVDLKIPTKTRQKAERIYCRKANAQVLHGE